MDMRIAALLFLFLASACTHFAAVTTLREAACENRFAEQLTDILVKQGEEAAAAESLAALAVAELRSDGSPRPFAISAQSGTDYAFLVERKKDRCLLRLYGRHKGFTTVTNDLTYIATRDLAPCECK